MSLFDNLEKGIPQSASPLEDAVRQSLISSMKDSFFQPPGRIVAAYIALAFLAIFEHARGYPAPPDVLTVSLVVFAILSVAISELHTYRVSSLSHERLRSDANAAKRAAPGRHAFFLITLLSIPELLSFAVVVPIVVVSAALLEGDLVAGFAPAVFMFAGGVVLVGTFRSLSRVYRWINHEARPQWMGGLKRALSTGGEGSSILSPVCSHCH